MAVTFLGIGSNLGDRLLYLKKAIQGLQQYGIDIVRCASVYETEPKDIGNGPWFMNTVVEATTNDDPQRLLESCLSVERDNGRVRSALKSSRTVDIDIIFIGEMVLNQAGLVVPHPRFRDRKFVLAPLSELAPNFIDPVSGRTVRELLDLTPDTAAVRRLDALL